MASIRPADETEASITSKILSQPLPTLKHISTGVFSAMGADFGQQYSGKKLKALMEFKERTPFYMILLYCLVVLMCPLPSIALLFLPFDSVTRGLTGKNYNFLLMAAMVALCAVSAIVVRLHVMLPSSAVTWRKTMLAALVFLCLCLG